MERIFYCEALPSDVLVRKGSKRISGRSSNTKASDNIISNGSGIAVADGQCMIIVEQGKIVEVCAEPGEFTYDASTEPSIFSGSLGQSILDTFKSVGKRFTYGGDTGKDQVECAPFEAEAKFCKNCGAKIEEPTKPCPTCGKPLTYSGKEWSK